MPAARPRCSTGCAGTRLRRCSGTRLGRACPAPSCRWARRRPGWAALLRSRAASSRLARQPSAVHLRSCEVRQCLAGRVVCICMPLKTDPPCDLPQADLDFILPGERSMAEQLLGDAEVCSGSRGWGDERRGAGAVPGTQQTVESPAARQVEARPGDLCQRCKRSADCPGIQC